MSCHFKLESLPDPGNRFTLGKEIGSGVSSNVFEAKDNEQGGMKVAVKIVKIVAEYEDDVKEEYRILKEFSAHPNLPNFYGAYYKGEQVWFVMELCEGGSVINLVRGLMNKAKHLTEEHIAFILKEITSALSYLHEKNIIHRDVRGSNVLLTKDGEIKLVDFGISRVVKGGESKLNTCVGSPCWMAPELIKSDVEGAENNYDNKIDVWALGITGIELADEEPPFQGMHPSRAIFQILRNPPPTFSVPSKWSQNYIDFVTECLEKNPEERPFVTEFLSHPFLTSLPEQDAHLGKELFILQQGITEKVVQPKEIHLRRGKLQTKHIEPEEDIIVEDLAGLDSASEELAMYHLEQRFRKGLCYTYVGDILLFVNPYKDQNIYGTKYHCKYQFKSRSDNSPHVYSIADSAYQDMLHHNQPQRIVLTGENLSGKTTNFKHILDHLLFLGHITSISEKIKATTNVIHAFGNAPTTVNTNSTRHVLNTQITYTKTGKLSGAIFWLYQLEKWRIGSNKLLGNENFHIFYYFHDALEEQNNLKSYNLEQGTNYKYLPRRNEDVLSKIGGAFGTRRVNAERYKEIMNYLSNVMEFPSTEIETIEKILAAVILLGEIGFTNDDDGHAEIENADIASKVAELLEADAEKFSWSLCNYCMVEKGTAQGRKYNATEASEARHVLARGMYSRLVDWIINIINMKLSITRAILGDVHYISVMDIPGFEVLEGNKIEQLFVNTLNEQLQYFYTQKDFACELKELEEEGIVLPPFQYYDNKSTIDELLSKPDGLFYIIDEATRTNSNYKFIIDSVANSGLNTRIKKRTSSSFTVAHYSGIIEYNTRDFPTINKDFISAEMTECLRGSNNSVVKQLFTNQLTKSGNLTIISEQNLLTLSGKGRRWGAALVSGGQKCKKFNTECYGEYSQTRNTRTASAVYRASSIEIMKVLSGALEDGSTRFVRCIRPNADESGLFKEKTVRLQLRSLAIIDTAKARQNGYSYRISFAEFIERYKFLAFDFNENVELTRDNCRLLLVRLKMEGWILGKTKVFLRYYDEEYLSRLYEIHVKKIVKIQAMMRTFITKRKILPRVQSQQSLGCNDGASEGERKIQKSSKNKIAAPINGKIEIRRNYTEEEVKAATVIQKEFKKYLKRQNEFDLGNIEVIKKYARKWKITSLYQILTIYRNFHQRKVSCFSHQVRAYNEHVVVSLRSQMKQLVSMNNLEAIDSMEHYIGHCSLTGISFRMPFQLNHTSLYDQNSGNNVEEEKWDSYLNCTKENEEREILIIRHLINVRDRRIQTECDDNFVGSQVIEPDSKSSPIKIKQKDEIGEISNGLSTTADQQPIEKTENSHVSTKTEEKAEVKVQVKDCKNLSNDCEDRKSIKSNKSIAKVSNVENVDFVSLKSSKNVQEVIKKENDEKIKEKSEMENETKETKKPGKIIANKNEELKNVKDEIKMVQLRKVSKKSELGNKQSDTIVELKIKGKMNIGVAPQDGSEDAPFNFQALLRKTGMRDSVKRDQRNKAKNIRAELYPGVVLEGQIYDL